MPTTKRDKQERIEARIKELSASFIAEHSTSLSLITITRVELDKKTKKITLYISVLPNEMSERALDFVRRKRSELRAHIAKKRLFGFVPAFEFEIDRGEQNRQRIDELSIQP